MRYAEDFEVGQVFPLGTRALTSEEIITFATEWDPQPFHIDPAAAALSPFGGLVASGVQTIALLQRLQYEAFVKDTAVIAGLGTDRMRLPRPVRPDTPISGTVTVAGVRRLENGRAVLTCDVELSDDGGPVMLATVGMMIAPRP